MPDSRSSPWLTSTKHTETRRRSLMPMQNNKSTRILGYSSVLSSYTTMESVGFAIGVAGLAGVFTACVDCFEYVQLGRQFGQDYEKCLLKLDAAKVGMSRWGAAMGLGPDPYLKQQISASDNEIRLAQSLLEQILDSFSSYLSSSCLSSPCLSSSCLSNVCLPSTALFLGCNPSKGRGDGFPKNAE